MQRIKNTKSKEEMQITDFGLEYGLKLIRDTDETEIVPGAHAHIYELGSDRLAIMFIPRKASTRRWRALKAQALAAGMTLEQDGDSARSQKASTSCKPLRKILKSRQEEISSSPIRAR